MKKKVLAIATGISGIIGYALPALAEETGTANQAVVTAMTGAANDMKATGTAVLPIALGVVGLILVVRYGLKIFKSASK